MGGQVAVALGMSQVGPSFADKSILVLYKTTAVYSDEHLMACYQQGNCTSNLMMLRGRSPSNMHNLVLTA